MAEQAINTIYLLGEQPDLLCSSVIKNLTSKVFDRPDAPTRPHIPAQADDDTATQISSPTKDAIQSPTKTARSRASSIASVKDDRAGAFALAQLVFIVGHVAMKHIVYLELVEREFKRRKDENVKRKCELVWLVLYR